ncbi:DUF1385 domain-containing protein [Ruminococcaceae bacterium OttesenSCG-928-O06]|nr:DUF1385 domain-containing protein [Ruminococcaceae bacterium OttesenSCG-928-O06]
MKPAKRSNVKTSVGGQAVLEGIMMRGPAKWCLAVRTPDGKVVAETHDTVMRPWAKWPFIRGVFNFVDSLVMGYKTLMRSAELAMGEEYEEEEPGKFDAWVEKKFGDAGTKVVMALASVLGIVLALGLFMFLPTGAVSLVDNFVPLGAAKPVLEGVVKILIFVLYLVLVRRMKDIHRVFSYHGAEHKTIYCYEAGDELTVENIRTHSRFHPRCGTSFIFIVLIISIFLNSALPWPAGAGGALLRMVLKLAMLPVVMAVSYEVLRLAGRYDNWFTRILSAPGMWIQRLTTNEPEDDMIEVAIAAVSPVLPPAAEAEEAPLPGPVG